VQNSARKVNQASHPSREGADAIVAAIVQLEQLQNLVDASSKLCAIEAVQPARQS
jgi:hypothetical protein